LSDFIEKSVGESMRELHLLVALTAVWQDLAKPLHRLSAATQRLLKDS
jgi:hypothetical protein